MSGGEWSQYGDGAQGRAVLSAICGSYKWGDNSMVSLFRGGHDLVNHELGHLFGFHHDDNREKYPDGCRCLGGRGCFMDMV